MIYVPTSRAHDKSVGRGEPHGMINAFPSLTAVILHPWPRCMVIILEDFNFKRKLPSRTHICDWCRENHKPGYRDLYKIHWAMHIFGLDWHGLVKSGIKTAICLALGKASSANKIPSKL